MMPGGRLKWHKTSMIWLLHTEDREYYLVRFLINGEPFDSIGGHIFAEELFERNEPLIRN